MQFIQTKDDQIEFGQAVASLRQLAHAKFNFWLSESRNPTSKSRFNAAKFAKLEAEQILSALCTIENASQVFSSRFVQELKDVFREVDRLKYNCWSAETDIEIIKILAEKGNLKLIKKYFLT